jgi:hypothetical protein
MKNGKGNNQQKGGNQGGAGGSGRRGRGAMDGTRAGSGPGGSCKCPDCGAVVEHKQGVPCYQERCPNCGQPLVRG